MHRNIDYASIFAEEKKETYQVMGWQGEKHAFLEGKKIAKVLLEQKASEVRTLTVGESWNMGEGYTLTANSIDAKAAARQAWFTLAKDRTKLYDIVLFPDVCGYIHRKTIQCPSLSLISIKYLQDHIRMKWISNIHGSGPAIRQR